MSHARRPATRRSPHVAAETLEPRTLFAVSSVWMADQTLVIECDNTPTQVSLASDAGGITIRHGRGSVARIEAPIADRVAVVEFRGGAASDVFRSMLDTKFVRAFGNGGDDTLQAGSAGSYMFGGAGRDRLLGGVGSDFCDGGPGADSIDTGATRDVVRGGDDDDVITGGDGADELYGDDGHDRIDGGVGDDMVYGGSGNDTLFAGADNDFLVGEAGDDRLVGGTGRDVLLGHEGNDGLIAGRGLTWLVGGAGADRLLMLPGSRLGTGDRTRDDAVIQLQDGGSAWTEAELVVVDEALAEVQSVTGSARLLQESRGGGDLVFRKQGQESYLGLNEEIPIYRKTWDVYRFKHVTRLVRIERMIHIAEFDEGSEAARREAALTVIHELAHNWDSADERAAAGLPADSWRQFAALSGWRPAVGRGPTHVVSGDGREAHAAGATDGFFGGDSISRDGLWIRYGRTNALEDFATSFEEWFARNLGRRTVNPHRTIGAASAQGVPASGEALAAAKLASVEALVRAV